LQLIKAESVGKRNIKNGTNTNNSHLSIHHFSFVRLFSQPLVNGANKLLNDAFAIVGADNDCLYDSLDLRPELTQFVAIQRKCKNASRDADEDCPLECQ